MRLQSDDTGGRTSELYRRFGPIIYSRCRRLLRDPLAAEDATQEVFLRVLKHIDGAPDDQVVLAWIYRISVNYCLNVHRDERRRENALAAIPRIEADDPRPALADRDVALYLLGLAPAHLRAPAWLYFVEGHEQKQIAKTLGISRRTVINRLNAFVARSKKRAGGERLLH